MSKIISLNKLNRFWTKGVKPIKDKVDNPISTYDDMMANTVAGYTLDPLAAKEGFNTLNNSLSIKKITTKTKLITLIGQLQTHGERKMFYAVDNTYFSDFPSALSAVSTYSPYITITRLDDVYILIEIVAFNAATGMPKTIKGICNWTTGTFAWGDVDNASDKRIRVASTSANDVISIGWEANAQGACFLVFRVSGTIVAKIAQNTGL